MNIKQFIKQVLRREGGFVNHPQDRGGPTNMGITQDTLSAWLKRPASLEDVRQLSEEVAQKIYEAKYFTGPRLDKLPVELQEQCFDIAVTSGPKRAVTLLQQVINLAGYGPVGEDGALGPQTCKAAAKAQVNMGPSLTNALVDAREAFMRRIVERDPSQKVFLKGWLKRCSEFRIPVAEGRKKVK